MEEKPIDWRGSSFKDLTDESVFSLEARKEAGTQLRKIQRGDEPDDWKPFDDYWCRHERNPHQAC